MVLTTTNGRRARMGKTICDQHQSYYYLLFVIIIIIIIVLYLVPTFTSTKHHLYNMYSNTLLPQKKRARKRNTKGCPLSLSPSRVVVNS